MKCHILVWRITLEEHRKQNCPFLKVKQSSPFKKKKQFTPFSLQFSHPAASSPLLYYSRSDGEYVLPLRHVKPADCIKLHVTGQCIKLREKNLTNTQCHRCSLASVIVLDKRERESII